MKRQVSLAMMVVLILTMLLGFIIAAPYPSLVSLAASESIIYVDADATSGNNDGTSWEHAFIDLQTALEDAGSGNQIWVAAGTYTPTWLFDGGHPRTATFQMKNGVAIYGGFDPTAGDTE